jgi:hypothetical protein
MGKVPISRGPPRLCCDQSDTAPQPGRPRKPPGRALRRARIPTAWPRRRRACRLCNRCRPDSIAERSAPARGRLARRLSGGQVKIICVHPSPFPCAKRPCTSFRVHRCRIVCGSFRHDQAASISRVTTGGECLGCTKTRNDCFSPARLQWTTATTATSTAAGRATPARPCFARRVLSARRRADHRVQPG